MSFIKSETPTRYLTAERAIRTGTVELRHSARAVSSFRGELVWELSGIKIKTTSHTYWVPYSNIVLVTEDQETQ